MLGLGCPKQTLAKIATPLVIERAKGLLMEKKGMGENEAHQALRKLAMDQGKNWLR
ncbi:ANTAR domain-containing protein [Solemya pervernicosa gill symbiont]|uniref:ANTAR domain-containing protein n=1 Tax=Solemya pervernicosa gill symbiont TaxID=642797 RepID=UPI0009962669